jgi:DNA-binding HxlR family transcriptional regulator
VKITKNESLLSQTECENSLKNVIDALYVLNGKWKLALILSLVQSSKRFNEIQHGIPGISSKGIGQRIKRFRTE